MANVILLLPLPSSLTMIEATPDESLSVCFTWSAKLEKKNKKVVKEIVNDNPIIRNYEVWYRNAQEY